MGNLLKTSTLVSITVLFICAISCSNSLTWILLGLLFFLYLTPTPNKTPTKRMSYSQYKAYLKSDTWKDKRLNRLIIDNYTCQICGIKVSENAAHCHHRTYKNLGNESEEDIITLCKDCHMELHSRS